MGRGGEGRRDEGREKERKGRRSGTYTYCSVHCIIAKFLSTRLIMIVGRLSNLDSVHLKQLIFLLKSDCLGCAVLLCLVVCLTLLASFFLLISY